MGRCRARSSESAQVLEPRKKPSWIENCAYGEPVRVKPSDYLEPGREIREL